MVLEDYPPKLREGRSAPAPTIIRLRQAQKVLLRAFGFRVVEEQELPAPVTPAARQASGTSDEGTAAGRGTPAGDLREPAGETRR